MAPAPNTDLKPQTARLERHGFAIVPAVLSAGGINRLLAELDQAAIARARRNGAVYGARNLLSIAAIRALANASALLGLVEPIVGHLAKPVRALLFDKTPQANWPVLWHQDLTIAVAKKREIEGFGRWSIKAGIVHVEPPVSVLETMVAVRLHLDDCGLDNGPLRVLPGTHRLGRLRRDQIATVRQDFGEEVCEASAGAALLMRPLLLHASSPAIAPNHRRVIHIEYAPADVLPLALAWAVA